MVKLTVNGQSKTIDVDEDTPLLWALRDHIGLTGTKFGCGKGLCGACTVHINGEAVRSCSVKASEVKDGSIVTIEGLSENTEHLVQLAWIAEDVPQCGFCQSGMIMAVAAFLKENPSPTDEEIDEAITNICRCGTYVRIRKAIHRAAAMQRSATALKLEENENV